jgi:hypothetical protein
MVKSHLQEQLTSTSDQPNVLPIKFTIPKRHQTIADTAEGAE